MSLRWRIMVAIVAVIVLTVMLGVGVGYLATQYRLGVFVDEIGADEARARRKPEPGVHGCGRLGLVGPNAV